MSSPRIPAPAADPRSPFQKFQDLARRVLTTPKPEEKPRPAKSHRSKKRKH